MNILQDFFNPGGAISAPIVLGVITVLISLFLAVLSPWVDYGNVWPTLMSFGLGASGLGTVEVGIAKFTKGDTNVSA